MYKIIEDMVKCTHMTPKKNEEFVDEDKELKLAATCEKRCPGCGFEEAMFIEMQTRSADEPMTVFYQCVKCRNTWKE